MEGQRALCEEAPVAAAGAGERRGGDAEGTAITLAAEKGTPVQVEENSPGATTPEASDEGRISLKHRFIELRAKGFSFLICAKRLKVGKTTLLRWSHELDKEISTLRAVEIEALHERCHMLREGRLKVLGAQFDRIIGEASHRDLGDVQTHRLHELSLAYYREMKAEADSCRPASFSSGEGAVSDTKGTAAWINDELGRLYHRYEAAEIGREEFQDRAGVLMLMLKAREQSDIENRIADLENRVEKVGAT